MERLLQVSTLVANVLVIGLFALAFNALDPFAETADADTETADAESEPKTQQEIDVQRDLLISLWASQGLTNVSKIVEEGNAVLSNSSSTIEQLKKVAEKSNTAANMVGYIEEEYADYIRENSRYEFITEEVEPAHIAYVTLANTLKDIRNKAYLELGKRVEKTGNVGAAFFYYRDAYRLSGFSPDREAGVRYKAEQEMKRLLGVNDIESFVSWL
jgi:hypothetical protein